MDKKEYHKKYYKKNRSKILEQKKEYYSNNKEKELKKDKDYYLKNKERILDKKKVYNNLHKEEITNKRRKQKQEYYLKNKEKIKIRQLNYKLANKEKVDKQLKDNRLKNKHIKAWRSLLRRTLKYFNTKKENNTIELLGYSALDLKNHLESKFKKGMTWDNYGEWHIDHIKPISSFDKNTLPSVVNALSNLQPLWAYENLSKGHKNY